MDKLINNREVGLVPVDTYASAKIEQAREFTSIDILKDAAKCVGEVEKFIKDRGYNLILFTGNSGFLSDKLLGKESGVCRAWLEGQNKRYNDPNGIGLMLNELGISPEECSLVIVDDHMLSGRIKAPESLLGLSNAGLKDFGFASFTGPRRYNDETDLSQESEKKRILWDRNLQDKLFFPSIKNLGVWKLLFYLESMADYYEKSKLIRDFVDTQILEIRKIKQTISPLVGEENRNIK